MRRIRTGILLGLVALLFASAPAVLAGRTWCRTDPTVSINGTSVQVWVGIPQEFVPYVNGPTEVTFKPPKNIKQRSVLFTDSGYNGYGEKISWQDAPAVTDTAAPLPLTIIVKLHVDQSKIDKAFGKGTKVPVEVNANVGLITETYTQLGYSTNTTMLVTFQIGTVSTP